MVAGALLLLQACVQLWPPALGAVLRHPDILPARGPAGWGRIWAPCNLLQPILPPSRPYIVNASLVLILILPRRFHRFRLAAVPD